MTNAVHAGAGVNLDEDFEITEMPETEGELSPLARLYLYTQARADTGALLHDPHTTEAQFNDAIMRCSIPLKQPESHARIKALLTEQHPLRAVFETMHDLLGKELESLRADATEGIRACTTDIWHALDEESGIQPQALSRKQFVTIHRSDRDLADLLMLELLREHEPTDDAVRAIGLHVRRFISDLHEVLEA